MVHLVSIRLTANSWIERKNPQKKWVSRISLQNYARRIQNFLFCRGIDTFEDQFNNVDGTLPESILPAGGYRKLRHSLGLVATSAAACIIGTQAKSWIFVDAVWKAKLEPYPDGYFDPYYNGLLYLFSLMHLSGNYRIITPGMK